MADTNAVKDIPETDAPDPGAESAPAEERGDAGGEVDPSENDSAAVDRSGHTVPVATVTALRAERRQLRSKVEAYEKQIQELTRTHAAPPKPRTDDTAGAPKETPTFFEDPDGHLAAREQKFREQIITDILGVSEKQEALKLIRSQNGFSAGDEDAMADLMEEHGLDVLARSQPLKAAKLAIKLWAEEKGIKPVSKESKAKAGSVRGGAPSGGTKKVALSQIRNLQDRLSKGENVDKELAEAWAAAKEGRIIED